MKSEVNNHIYFQHMNLKIHVKMVILASLLIAMSCKQPEQKTPETIPQGKISIPAKAEKGADTTKWTDQFLALQKAIISGDLNAMKLFIDFPILNKGNEIWFLADSKLVMDIDPKVIKPFTESDFDKYFSNIFALDLRKTLEKLNTAEFFQGGKSSSPEIVVVKGSKTKLEARYDKKTQKITLRLITSDKDFQDFSINYLFEITVDQKIKFRQVQVTG